MEDKLQIIRNWARRGNLKQFYTDMQPRIESHGYTCELDLDTIRCYRVNYEKSLFGLRKRVVREPVGAIKRTNGSFDIVEPDEDFVEVLAKVARA